MPWLTFIGSNYPWLEHFSMVPKVIEPLKFDCKNLWRSRENYPRKIIKYISSTTHLYITVIIALTPTNTCSIYQSENYEAYKDKNQQRTSWNISAQTIGFRVSPKTWFTWIAEPMFSVSLGQKLFTVKIRILNLSSAVLNQCILKNKMIMKKKRSDVFTLLSLNI